ncbi:MAG: rhodanese-like domain-containing protein [Firmicutes bacterium]|nr:rhodanese-like domain-containing protein [Bacillota bacterium]
MKRMRRVLLLALLVMAAALLAGCVGSNSSAEYHKISAADAKAKMDSGTAYTLVDVRTKEEYTAQRIDGAVNIPVDQIKDLAAAMLPDKDALILIYCRSGNRSSSAAHTLVGLGYTNVYDFGGIIDWPYDTVTG